MAQIYYRSRQDYRPIDFDFYRKQAAALRSQAKRNAFKSEVAFRLAMILVAATFTGRSSRRFNLNRFSPHGSSSGRHTLPGPFSTDRNQYGGPRHDYADQFRSKGTRD
jgi:hypothetical protein